MACTGRRGREVLYLRRGEQQCGFGQAESSRGPVSARVSCSTPSEFWISTAHNTIVDVTSRHKMDKNQAPDLSGGGFDRLCSANTELRMYYGKVSHKQR